MMANETIWGKVMATTINKEDILKAVQAMSQEDRLKLISEIAVITELAETNDVQLQQSETTDFDQEVMNAARQFIDKHRNLLRRLAE
jgi:hypothetical protein